MWLGIKSSLCHTTCQMALTSSYLLACLHLPAANLYAVSTSTPENAVLLLNDETRRIQKSLQHPNVITRLRLARNFLGGQERLLTSCKDGSVRVWDIQSGDCIRTCERRDFFFSRTHDLRLQPSLNVSSTRHLIFRHLTRQKHDCSWNRTRSARSTYHLLLH